MATSKYPGIAVSRGMDPDIAAPLMQIDTALRQLSAGSGPVTDLAVAGGQVTVGTGPAPTAGQALVATTKTAAQWQNVMAVSWKYERLDSTVVAATQMYECPTGYNWLPTFFQVRSRNLTFDSSGTSATISFGIVGAGYIDIVAATTLAFSTGLRTTAFLPQAGAFSVREGTQLYANISVASAPGPAILDIYGIGILVPK